MRREILTALALASVVTLATAQPPSSEAEAPPPPPPAADTGARTPPAEPPERVEGEVPEPEVTIIRRDEQVIKEYRINGQLYMVEITPRAGAPYYLFDTDGDGTLDTRRGSLREGTQTPQWILFRW